MDKFSAFKKKGRIPIDFGSTAVTGMHVSIVAALRDYYGLASKPVKIIEPFQMLGEIDAELKEIIGVNVDGVYGLYTMFGFPLEKWKEWRTPWGQEVLVPGNFNTKEGPNNSILLYPQGDLTAPASGKLPDGGYFFDAVIRQQPIEEEKLNPADNLQEFQLVSAREIDFFQEQVYRYATPERLLIANFGGTGLGDIALVPATGLKYPQGIRDVTEWYISTASRQDFIHAIFDAQMDIAIENLRRIHETIKDKIDVIFICGTDFGTQDSSFCSPETFRVLYTPYYKRINDWVHTHTNWKTFKHSCGAVKGFIPLFIEAGFDIINPVQCSARDMDPKGLKDEYGRDILFWGGGVDTQKTLPFGTANEVYKQVIDRCRIFAADDGYVFNAIHNVQAKTPVENVVAMIDAVNDFNKG